MPCWNEDLIAMNWLKKRHERLTPPGMEVAILRKLLPVSVVGTLLVTALPIVVRFWPERPGVDAARHIRSVDIFAIAAEVTLLVAIGTVAIGCVIVHIMKGPAYMADSLPVSHSDEPDSGAQSLTPRVGTRHRGVVSDTGIEEKA